MFPNYEDFNVHAYLHNYNMSDCYTKSNRNAEGECLNINTIIWWP